MITSENAFFLYRLLLAHYVADFPLQTTKVFLLKISGLKGGMVHAGIVGITSAIFLAPIFPTFWPYLILLTVIHWVEDDIRVRIGKKFNLDNLWLFLLDQVLHVFVSWWILQLAAPWRTFTPPAHPALQSGSFADAWNYHYYNDQLVIQLMFFVIATYAGGILYMYLEKYWMPENLMYQIGEPRQMISLVERGILFALAFWRQWPIFAGWTAMRFALWCLRRGRFSPHQRRQMGADALFNALFAVSCYAVMRRMLGG